MERKGERRRRKKNPQKEASIMINENRFSIGQQAFSEAYPRNALLILSPKS